MLLFFISQVLYLSSEPQGFSIQVQAYRSDYWRYQGRSGIFALFVPWKKARPYQVRFCTNITQARGGMASCQGVLVLLNVHKANSALCSTSIRNTAPCRGSAAQNSAPIHLFVASLWVFFPPLILLFKQLNKEVGCFCYQICEKHSVSRISEQLRCWVFQAINTELNWELENHPGRPCESCPASRPSRIKT